MNETLSMHSPGPVLSMLDPRVMDPHEHAIDRSALSDDAISQTVDVLEAMKAWRDAEREMSEASRRYMKLGDNDMRALRFLLASDRHGVLVTPTALAGHLEISAAAVTKMLDRLSAGGHITRHALPGDRRSISVTVTPSTAESARSTVGRNHARRFDVIAALGDDDRAAVLRFFAALMTTAETTTPTGGDESLTSP